MSVALPAIDLRNEIRHAYSSSVGYKSCLFPGDIQLLIGRYEVVVIQGACVSRKFIYEEPVVSATYTTFNSKPGVGVVSQAVPTIGGKSIPISLAREDENSANAKLALVVCLRKAAHIYYKDGRSYVVSLPFTLKSVFPFDFGLILEKEPSPISGGPHQPAALQQAKFLTLVDPIGEFRLVTTSSTSVVSAQEELVAFRRSGLARGGSSMLCATYNRTDGTVVLYHAKSSTRGNGQRQKLALNQSNRSTYKRKPSLLSAPKVVIEDDEDMDHQQQLLQPLSHPLQPQQHQSLQSQQHLQPQQHPSQNLVSSSSSSSQQHPQQSQQHIPSINMEKKRTSTLLSDISSIARMGSEPGFPDQHSSTRNDSTLRKDLILTRLDTFSVKPSGIHTLQFEDQEALVISSESKTQVYIYRQQPSHIYRYQSCYTLDYSICIPLENNSHQGWLVVLTSPSSIKLVNPFLEIESIDLQFQAGSFPAIHSLQSSCGSDVSMKSESGKSYILRLVLEPSSTLVTMCLKCFRYLSGSKIRETLWMLWCSAMTLDESKDEWNAFIIMLLSIIYPMSNLSSSNETPITKLLPAAKILHETASFQYSFGDLAPFIVLSLHLVQEELKLDALSGHNLSKLGQLLTQLTTWMGWSEMWTSYYMIDNDLIDNSVQFLSVSILESPPNILESLCSLFGGKIIRYVTFSQLVEEDESVDRLITPKTYYILRLFEVLVSPHYGPNELVDMMCEYGISSSDLELYPPGIYLPLKEVISHCQERPAFEWTSEALELVGRRDLSRFLETEYNRDIGSNKGVTGGASAEPSNTFPSIQHILSNVFDKNESITAWDGQAEADRISITKLIFDYDRRFYEITTLLHQTKVQTASLKGQEVSLNEYDIVVLQRELAALVALRTLTIPLGRAALFYSSRMPLMTEKFPIPKFNFNTLISPSMATIVLSKDSLNENTSEWGYFHNGVSSGLMVSPESKGISGSWIIFNKPPELNSQHAGFLLGLGLNGHLKKLEEWHIYNYLGPKHPLTSVGLLIGMAASLRGTMDNKLTKVLSVHAVALLPQGANDLNVPIIVQTAGLIGIGLLYLATQHRRMSEVLLLQVTGSVSQNDSEQIHEGYRLAAGIALGFVNLGKGNDLKGLGDTHVIDKLLALATSMKDFQTSQELDKSCCGAVMALGFIYMKTGQVSIANKLTVPETERLLDYIRPDLLLLRCMARNIIMWDQTGDSIEWVESEIPICLREKYMTIDGLNELNSDQLAFFNVLGGICMALAVKNASSQSKMARDTLLHFLDLMMEVSARSAKNYDEKIAQHSAISIRNLLALCVSVVMAGSGDLETFRRLRILHGDTSKEMEYGSYMAINMALGFLFLGGGQYAFSTSHFSIACLVTSMYPVFPSSNSDYEVHLQAMRHFWALAVEPRCLVIRDVTSNLPCKVPIEIHKSNGDVIETNSPCLLPPFREISQIKVSSNNHFEVTIDFYLNSSYLENFKKTFTIFVYRRRNHQLLEASVGSLLKNENQALQVANGEIAINSDLSMIGQLEVLKQSLDEFERKVLLYESNMIRGDEDSDNSMFSMFNVVDNKIELAQLALKPRTVNDLWNLRLIFAFSDTGKMSYVSHRYVDNLRKRMFRKS
ncbi:anaphase-promoting complex subunit 1 [[Candida] anglica]